MSEVPSSPVAGPVEPGGSSPEAVVDNRDPLRPFFGRRGRLVGFVSAAVSVLIFGGVAALMPGKDAGGSWGAGDRVLCVLFGLAIAWLLVRYATIRATPDRESLKVRNLLVTRVIPWSQIQQVRFADGDPWVTLELAGHETVAVMAIQRADGAGSRPEAVRLASLVQALSGR